MCRAAGFASLLLAVTFALCCGQPQERAFDRALLEEEEDLSEALANDLLTFSVSVRDRDYEAMKAHFADPIRATPWPSAPSKVETLVRWIDKGAWTWPEGAEKLAREDFLSSFQAFLEQFGEIEDARFKVKAAKFDLRTRRDGEAHIKFYLVGRDAEGMRLWIKGTGHIEAEIGESGPWRLRQFELESLESKSSREDLFSEIAFPAGVAAVFPPFGVGRNQGFVSHGAAVSDVNGDGLLDIAASGVDQNYLFLNKGDGKFADASQASLVAAAPTGSGAVFLDYDNDGDPDLFFAAVGTQILLENRFVPDGKVQFWDVSEKAGVSRTAVGFSALAGDVNGDGRPDVYVCSYNHYGTVMPNSWVKATNGTPNLLFINQGDGSFREASAEWGVDDGRWTYAASFVDIDEDGDLDLYVANDFGENAMYRNDGGRFTDVAESMGVVDPGFGMGVSFGDYDNDGRLDLHVTNMSSTAGNRILQLLYPEQHVLRRTLAKQAAGNSLFRNLGDGRFEDVTTAVGGLAGGWAFGGGFVDFDNDGWEDLHTPNGFVSGKTMNDT